MLIALKLSTAVGTRIAADSMQEKLDHLTVATTQALRAMPPHAAARDAAPFKPVPPSSRRFTGREDYLSKLRLFFSPQNKVPLQRRHFLQLSLAH